MLARVKMFNEALWNMGVNGKEEELIQRRFPLTVKKRNKSKLGGFYLPVGKLIWTEKFNELYSSIFVSGVES